MKKESGKGLRVLLLGRDDREAESIRGLLLGADPSGTVLRVDGREAFRRALDSFLPDVILFDHDHDELGSLDLLRLSQARRPESPFVLISEGWDQGTSAVLRAGAAELVLKSELDRLMDAIHSALAVRAPLQRLTTRQLQVMQLLVAGCSTRETARRLRVSIKTIETHRSQLMKRLGFQELTGLVRFAVSIGMVSATQ